MEISNKGYEANLLEVTLSPGEQFFAQRGALVYVEKGIHTETMWNGKGIWKTISTAFSGESLLIVRYTNQGTQPHKLCVAGSRLGLYPLFIREGQEVILRRSGYVASVERIELTLDASLKKLFSGMGLLFQKVRGNGMVFIDTVGQPIAKTLSPGETIQLDEDHLIALEGISDDRIVPSVRVRNLLQGEGFSRMRVTGPGTVVMSPISIYSDLRGRRDPS